MELENIKKEEEDTSARRAIMASTAPQKAAQCNSSPRKFPISEYNVIKE